MVSVGVGVRDLGFEGEGDLLPTTLKEVTGGGGGPWWLRVVGGEAGRRRCHRPGGGGPLVKG
jgi:hypothetical protein